MEPCGLYLLRSRLCAAIDNRVTSICKIVLKPLQFLVLDAKPRQFLFEKLVIHAVEGFLKVDKHRCRDATIVNTFPNTIREIFYRILGRVIFPKTALFPLFIYTSSPSLFIILDPLRVVCVTHYPCESLPFGSVVHG